MPTYYNLRQQVVSNTFAYIKDAEAFKKRFKDIEDIDEELLAARWLVERTVVRKLLDTAKAMGFELAYSDAGTFRTAYEEVEEIMAEIQACDVEYVHLQKDGKSYAVQLIYGNDGYDVISDYATKLDESWPELMEAVDELVYQLEDQQYEYKHASSGLKGKRLLLTFLQDWLAWAQGKASKIAYDKRAGLCYAYQQFICSSTRDLPSDFDGIFSDFNSDIFPFDGFYQQYLQEAARGQMHKNKKRIGWVKMKIYELQEEVEV